MWLLVRVNHQVRTLRIIYVNRIRRGLRLKSSISILKFQQEFSSLRVSCVIPNSQHIFAGTKWVCTVYSDPALPHNYKDGRHCPPCWAGPSTDRRYYWDNFSPSTSVLSSHLCVTQLCVTLLHVTRDMSHRPLPDLDWWSDAPLSPESAQWALLSLRTASTSTSCADYRSVRNISTSSVPYNDVKIVAKL